MYSMAVTSCAADTKYAAEITPPKFKALVLSNKECLRPDESVRHGRHRSLVLQPLGVREKVLDCPKKLA